MPFCLSITYDRNTLKQQSYEEQYFTDHTFGTKSWLFGISAAVATLAISFKASEYVADATASFVENQCNNFVEKWSMQPTGEIKDHLSE